MSDKWKSQDKYEAVSKLGTGGQSKYLVYHLNNDDRYNHLMVLFPIGTLPKSIMIKT